MVNEEAACLTAQNLSRKFAKIFRVYRTPSGNHWVRQDPKPMTTVDGIKLVHICAYKNGCQVLDSVS